MEHQETVQKLDYISFDAVLSVHDLLRRGMGSFDDVLPFTGGQ